MEEVSKEINKEIERDNGREWNNHQDNQN